MNENKYLLLLIVLAFFYSTNNFAQNSTEANKGVTLLKESKALTQSRKFDLALIKVDSALLFIGDSDSMRTEILLQKGTVLYLSRNKNLECTKVNKEGLSISQKIFGELAPMTGKFYNNLGSAIEQNGDVSTAKEYFLKAHEIFKLDRPSSDTYVANTSMNLSRISLQQAEFEDAINFWDVGISIVLEQNGENDLRTAKAYTLKVDIFNGIGDYESAKFLFE